MMKSQKLTLAMVAKIAALSLMMLSTSGCALLVGAAAGYVDYCEDNPDDC